MGIITPLLDVVAGVAILAGRSSLLDTGVFKTANTNFTIRHILALGFIGVGVWNLWKIERAQDKLKKSLGAEIWAEAVDWFDEQGSDNEGFPYGISYMAGPERGEIEWFSDEEERDMVLDTYIGEMEGELYTTDPETGMVVPMNAESFGAESCQHEWRKVNYGQHPKRFSHVWLCDKCNARIDSINMPSENRKVRPNSYTRNWKWPKQSYYFGAEPFGVKCNDPHNKGCGKRDYATRLFNICHDCQEEMRAESFGAEPMFVESDSLMVELMGFDGSYRTDGEVKVGYTTAAELGFEPKELKPVMWVWDDIEGYGAFMPTEKIRFIAEYFE